VVDRARNLVDANASVALFTAGVESALLAPPVNVLRVNLHPAGMAPHIVNLSEWRAHLLGRLRRQVALTAAPDLAALYAELRAYPSVQPEPAGEPPASGAIVVPLHFRVGDRTLAFFSTVATFGTPLDVTVAELAIESFFPADTATARFLQDQVGTASSAPSA
jgi:hypothetical protein